MFLPINVFRSSLDKKMQIIAKVHWEFYHRNSLHCIYSLYIDILFSIYLHYALLFIVIMSVSEKQTDKFDIKNMQYLKEKHGMWKAFPNLL